MYQGRTGWPSLGSIFRLRTPEYHFLSQARWYIWQLDKMLQFERTFMNGVRSQPRLCRSSSGLSHWFRDISHFVNINRRILHFSALLLSVSLGSIMTLFGRFSYLFSLVFFYLSFLLRLFKKKWGKTNKFYYNINNRHKYSLPCNSFNFS